MPGSEDSIDAMIAQWKEERPELDTTGMPVVLRVQLLASIFAERLKAILAPFELAPFEYEVLSALRRSGAGGATPTELCRAGLVTSGTMTHRLDRLEERGLVRRERAETDRRNVVITLTRRGRSLVDGILDVRMEDAARSLRTLTKRDRKALAKLLRAVTSDVEGPS